jgi:hypothetical protein
MAFEEKLIPIAQVNENILIIPENRAFKVKKVIPLPTLIYDFGSLSASTKDTEPIDIVKDTAKLEMPDNTLAQFRMKALDDFEVYFKQPKTTSKWVSVHREFFFDMHTPYENLTEWFQFEDRSAGIIRNNPSTTALNKTRIMFFGFKYELEELKAIPPKYTVVEVASE